MGIPAPFATGIAPRVAPEHAAPAIPTTPASTSVCAPVAAVVPSHPESASTSEK